MSIKKVLYHIITICFCSLFVFLLPAFAWQGTVISVHDGDSMRIQRTDGAVVTIRVYGIDCPELRQAFGQRAKSFTIAAAAGKMVSVDVVQKDRYGRSVALVTLPDGQILSRILLREGAAWVYTKYCKRPECAAWSDDEAAARDSGYGLWAEDRPVPPWEWRKKQR